MSASDNIPEMTMVLLSNDPTPVPTESLRLVIAFIDKEIARLQQSMRCSGESFDLQEPCARQRPPSERTRQREQLFGE